MIAAIRAAYGLIAALGSIFPGVAAVLVAPFQAAADIIGGIVVGLLDGIVRIISAASGTGSTLGKLNPFAFGGIVNGLTDAMTDEAETESAAPSHV